MGGVAKKIKAAVISISESKPDNKALDPETHTENYEILTKMTKLRKLRKLQKFTEVLLATLEISYESNSLLVHEIENNLFDILKPYTN